MTTTTRYRVLCMCGHSGAIKMRENDAPFSKQWESYSLEGLNGGTIQGGRVFGWDEVFADIKPTCPECGALLTPDQLVDR